MRERKKGNQSRFRSSRGLPEKKRVLIICEGSVEKWYFDNLFFDANHLKHHAIIEAKDPVKIVEFCIKKLTESREKNKPYETAWCVFDHDDTKFGILESAMSLARQNGINVGFSNPCFELWILSHFKKIDTEMSAGDIKKDLRNYVGGKYHKNEKFILKKVIPKLLLLTRTAVENTAHLSEKNCHKNPHTNLEKLVTLLNETGDSCS